jgi:hypothetical protein
MREALSLQSPVSKEIVKAQAIMFHLLIIHMKLCIEGGYEQLISNGGRCKPVFAKQIRSRQ